MNAPRHNPIRLAAAALLVGAALATAQTPASNPAKKVAGGNLDYWLSQGKPTPASAPASAAADPNIGRDRPLREDALPGAVELSDGRQIAGYLYTTRDKDWELYIESEKAYRRIPFIAVLGIEAKVVEEKMENEWRWKEMGKNERVFTGRTYPSRRLAWEFHLIDGTTVTGTLQGQPLWIEYGGRKSGPLVLGEHIKAGIGEPMEKLVHVRRVVVSQRMMDEVLKNKP